MANVLYTCGQKARGPVQMHPCALAARALDKAGIDYEIKPMKGYRMMPWTWASRGRDREEVRRLSGTNEVPILVLDDGEVISDSRRIARWAKEQARSQAS